jgi:hypothetical protein
VSVWTPPRTWVTGEVPTAATFNTHVRDNLNSICHTQYVKATEKDVANTAATIDVLNSEVTIPAGMVTATGSVTAKLIGDYLNNTGVNQALTLEIKLGTTTLFKDTTSNIGTSTARRPWTLDLLIGARNSQASQFLAGVFTMGGTGPLAGIGSLAVSGAVTAFPIGSAFAAVDMTAAQTLVVNATHSAANAALSFRLEYALILVQP